MSDSAAEGFFDFSGDEAKTGFRLDRLELYNWGTFDRQVWKLETKGANALLTGDIGSGKSTIVDAISTLLVPPQRLAYNKAAGAAARERSLRSYVLGHYKSERGETDISSKAVALRDQNSYSVILAVFTNEGLGQSCTLAQLFWIRDQGQPSRLYVFATRELSVAADFAGFGSDISELRKRLRAGDGVEIFDAFTSYSAAWRRVFGIDNEQALELFNQTVSMKSVGNLTDFVREHMLERFEGEARIQALIHHFDDLDRAHEAVLKAKARIDSLSPIVADCESFALQSDEKERLRLAREALGPWFATRKLELLDARLARLEAELQKQAARTGQSEEKLSGLNADRDELKLAIATKGGDRLERLGAEIQKEAEERDRRRVKLERYATQALFLGLPVPKDPDDFARNRERLTELSAELADTEMALQNERTELEVSFRTTRDEYDSLKQEIASLRQRRSNIPQAQIAIRDSLCSALEIPAESIPFAGELVRVKDGETAWEGAAERLLRNFALSLLVPETQYAAVSAWVEEQHLHGRLVYFRAKIDDQQAACEQHPDSLARKLEVKRGAALEGWVSRELARRFDHACCDSLEQFRREPFAVTRRGQIKSGGDRHEKDDRSRLDDRSRYVLGWTNEAKIKALENQAAALEARIAAKGAEIGGIQRAQSEARKKLEAAGRVMDTADWKELDWSTPGNRLAALEKEKARLEASADILRTLGARLAEVEADIGRTEKLLLAARQEHTAATVRKDDSARERASAESTASAAVQQKEASFASLASLAAEHGSLVNLSIESIANRESSLREIIQASFDALEKRQIRLRDKIVAAMQAFANAWPLETRELDASLDAAQAWKAMLDGLRADDLPRFEQAFKSLLNENTIREIANFQSQLNRERQLIKERLEKINTSLEEIDYNPGRYIVLESRPSPDGEIQTFMTDLRACTEGSLTGSAEDQYSESKFIQVKRIIERFRGREGYSEMDRRWTDKVSDVRQYFVFSASERWKEDHKEYEHYTDSGGKSGGQKEKLAYTVLAASLAYQFGLEKGSPRSRSFRFVMIDEAFGRGSDDSTRYGLRLFKTMNLQLLIITPLQKIHIIEPYISSLGFVYNENGRDSKLRNLSIGEYRAERERRKSLAP